jgi:hypothetical protein
MRSYSGVSQNVWLIIALHCAVSESCNDHINSST